MRDRIGQFARDSGPAGAALVLCILLIGGGVVWLLTRDTEPDPPATEALPPPVTQPLVPEAEDPATEPEPPATTTVPDAGDAQTTVPELGDAESGEDPPATSGQSDDAQTVPELPTDPGSSAEQQEAIEQALEQLGIDRGELPEEFSPDGAERPLR